MTKRSQSLNLHFQHRCTDDRFIRRGQNQLLDLIRRADELSSVPNKKSPLDYQKNNKQTEELKIEVSKPKVERITIGSDYKVTEDWNKFWELYSQHFIPASVNVVHYLNQVVTVLQIQEDLVQVRFRTPKHPEGWLPAVVLQSTRDIQLVFPEPKKKKILTTAEKTKQEVSQKLFYQKKLFHKKRELDALKNENEMFQQALQKSNSQNRHYEHELRELENTLKEAETGKSERESLRSQLQSTQEALRTCQQEKEQMCQKIEELHSSWVPKDIAHLDCLLEDCSSPDLFQAQSKVQAKVQQCLNRAELDLKLQKHHQNSQKTCVICLDEAKSHMFEPCRHYCVCEECSHEVLERFPKKCPICRGGVVTSSRVYV